MSREYLDNLDSDGGDVVPEGEYDLEVVDARGVEGKAFLFMDLKVLNGPDKDRVVSVGLNIPGPGAQRGAVFHFKKKVRGFPAVVVAANEVAGDDDEQFAAEIAEHLIGHKFRAGLSVQSGGAYEGSQQLDWTKELGDAATAAPPTAAVVTAPTPAPEPVPVETVSDDVPF